MKPREAADYLKLVMVAVSKTGLPPNVRGWFCQAVTTRLNDPDSSLDKLLGLRSSLGGWGSLRNKRFDRNKALRTMAAYTGLPTADEQADEILRRKKAGELAHIEVNGRIPGKRQLLRIISQ